MYKFYQRGLDRLSLLLLAGICLFAPDPVSAQAPGRATRSVIDTERGGYFTYPYGDQWSRYGAEFGRTHFSFDQMPAMSLKGLHGRLQHFASVDNPPYGLAYFPWTEFLAYNADEVAQGRPSMVMTATYQGTKRPLYFSYGSYNPSLPFQGVHVRDDRFVKFWIKNYVRTVMSDPYFQNWWVGADNCTFRYDLYGVLDNSGNYIKNLPWDAPFPQNDTQWIDANIYMLSKVKEWAPNIRIACNDIGLNDSQASRQTDFWPYIDGVIREEFWYLDGGGDDWWRTAFYQSFQRDIDRSALGKVEVIDVPMSPTDTTLLRRSFVAFLILGGDNLFFGPQDDNNDSRELNPALWADWRNRLGRPMLAAQSAQESGRSLGHRLYWRECEGGICYLNWTGGNKTITLPVGRTCYDRNGNQVTSITLGDMVGDYVLFSQAARVSWPAINPRYPGLVTGPVSVTIDMDPSFGTGATIRYTTNGTDPTASSPIYTGPINLAASATVKARAFKAGMQDSFVNAANYLVTFAQPTVQFHLASDSGSEFLKKDFPLVKLNNPAATTVTVTYAVSGGSATNGSDYTLSTGTLTFPPGEQYRFFPIQINNDTAGEPSETIAVSLSNPVNATLGAQTTYTYTINDNDGGAANQPPVLTITSPPNGASVTLPSSQALTATVADDLQPSPPATVTITWSKQSGPGNVTFSDLHALSTSATFSLPGSYLLRCTATDGALSTSRDLSLVVRDSFAAWVGRVGGGDENSDPEWDGMVTLLEYALVGNPTVHDSAARLQSKLSGNRLALTFARDTTRTDLTIAVWGADSLSGPWTELASSVAGAPFTILLSGAGVTETPNGDLREVEIRDVFTIGDPAHPCRFLQLRAGH
jgi:hypothetical protein